MSKKHPLFISGVYRSGTTLPVKILNTHPEISITHDSVNFFRYYLKYAETIEEDYTLVVEDCADRLFKRFKIEMPSDEVIAKIKSAKKINLSLVFEEMMRATFCDGRDDIIWGEKSLLQWSNIPLFLQMYEGSKTIMIIRDPRDVLASFRDFTIESGARYLDAIFACLHSLEWSATIGKSIDPDRFRIVYFEEIVADPKSWSKEMCKFLALDYYNGMTDSRNFKDHSGNEWSPNTSYKDLGGKISSNPVNRWKEKLSDTELCFAESILGEAMKLHGYEPSEVKIGATELHSLFKTIGETDLLQHRLSNWYETSNGVESHPSDPTQSKNWSKTMQPKDKKD